MITTHDDTAVIECPTWCVRTDHHADVVNAAHPPMHYGPDFGVFTSMGEGDAPSLVLMTDDSMSMDLGLDVSTAAEKLRTVAADALALAQWIEAQR